MTTTNPLDAHVMEQLPLFTLNRRGRSIQERYEEWRRQNPHIYPLFRQFATQAMERGRTRFSQKAIVERIRWYTTIDTRGDDFKMNDHYTSRMVRDLIEEDARFDDFFDFFETRKLRSP